MRDSRWEWIKLSTRWISRLQPNWILSSLCEERTRCYPTGYYLQQHVWRTVLVGEVACSAHVYTLLRILVHTWTSTIDLFNVSWQQKWIIWYNYQYIEKQVLPNIVLLRGSESFEKPPNIHLQLRCCTYCTWTCSWASMETVLVQ